MLCLLPISLITLQQTNDSSTDKDLLQLIATLSKQIPTSIKSTDELINAAMTRVVVAVGGDLLNGNVMLLPDVQICLICMQVNCHLTYVKRSIHQSLLHQQTF